jgi:antitoxin (DNA-binding transcriptional repressor) of toxin-antitoxin stability system
VFVSDHDPNLKGNVAELKIAAEAARLGIPVLRPMTEHERYDLMFELGGEFKRVQCKHASRKGDVVVVRIRTNRRGPEGFISTKYTADEIDAVAAYCPELDECFYLPIEVVEGMTTLHLRLAPARNGQRAAVNFAADYRLGAVAQLEVARRWQRRGRGFESHRLHSRDRRADLVTIGAHEVRTRFGWYAERASAGESFLITRRGKPYARLSPPHEQLDLPAPEPAEVVPIEIAKERRA